MVEEGVGSSLEEGYLDGGNIKDCSYYCGFKSCIIQ